MDVECSFEHTRDVLSCDVSQASEAKGKFSETDAVARLQDWQAYMLKRLHCELVADTADTKICSTLLGRESQIYHEYHVRQQHRKRSIAAQAATQSLVPKASTLSISKMMISKRRRSRIASQNAIALNAFGLEFGQRLRLTQA
mmetsp:Transcript_49910/g.82817  ORF Transcript_49910/g.82817 Transcript_49910/m.82817 type:complete len:143 (+) Transcript_49910:24-452(+)